MNQRSPSARAGPFRLLDSGLRSQLRRGEQPTRIEPQLATVGATEPPSDWLYERWYDGMRLLGFVRRGEVRLRARKHVPIDETFPELVHALRERVSHDLILDGEVVALEGDGRSPARLQSQLAAGMPLRGRARFERVERPRDGGQQPQARPAPTVPVPVRLYVFDLLHLDGYDLRQLPLVARKQLLSAVVHFDGPIQYSEHRSGDGRRLLEEACSQGWAGLVAKDPSAPYLAGRSRRWRTLSCVRGQELVVGGYTPPAAGRRGFGALLLGYHDPSGRLRYAGKVGTGFDATTVETLGVMLERLQRPSPPFTDPPADREARWVDPHIVVHVSFADWTEEGRVRQPRFDGLRIDLDPAEVVREPLG